MNNSGIVDGFYWRLDDGRVWGAAEGKFMAELPDGAEPAIPNGPDDKPLTYAGLPWLITFYNGHDGHGRNFPLGELTTPDETIKQFETAVAARLDAFALEKQYDNMDKARLAALTSDFKADGDFANLVYDRVWTAAFDLEERIRGGALSVGDALARLPEMRWPPAPEG